MTAQDALQQALRSVAAEMAAPPREPVAVIVDACEECPDWGFEVSPLGVTLTGALGVTLLKALRARRVQLRRERGEVVR